MEVGTHRAQACLVQSAERLDKTASVDCLEPGDGQVVKGNLVRLRVQGQQRRFEGIKRNVFRIADLRQINAPSARNRLPARLLQRRGRAAEFVGDNILRMQTAAYL